MRKMVAMRPFSYRGVQLAAGQEFEADDEHVRLFELIGQARVKGAGQGYETRVMTAKAPRSRRVETT